MLSKVSIQNYALIQQLEIDFTPGFSVITGETGAGKSILLGALALILGQRSDTSVLFDDNRKCIVEGVFSVKGYSLENFFVLNDLDYDETVILRREINPGGKSRAYINDSPVTLSQLKDLGERLVNIHSQQTIITLNDSDFQLAVVDNYARTDRQVREYRISFIHFLKLRKQLEEMQGIQANNKSDQDYYSFLLEELKKAELREDEQEELEKRLETLTHAEEIKNNLYRSSELLTNSENSILHLLSNVISVILEVSKYHNDLEHINERLKSDQIDLKDIASEIDRLADRITYDPAEIENLTQRLDLIYRLQKKHRVSTVKELKTITQNIENVLFNTSNLEEKIKSLQHEADRVGQELWVKARIISKERMKSLPAFEKEIVSMLMKLGMPKAQFAIDSFSLQELTVDGIDKVCFLFSANKGVAKNEVSKIASGGELSRLMLSIKSMISRKNLLPTIVFDEIDSGVSGEIAGKVGDILRKMSENMQVIAITHLPQIAGKGDHHYKVYKVDEKESAHSEIKRLITSERVEEIAKMLSNKTVSKAAYQTAKELLDN